MAESKQIEKVCRTVSRPAYESITCVLENDQTKGIILVNPYSLSNWILDLFFNFALFKFFFVGYVFGNVYRVR